MERIKRSSRNSKSRQALNPSICRIENFSNEIFCEIFDYLDGYDIYKAFSNLNNRFKNLLINSSFLLKIEFSYTSIFDHRYKHFIQSNKHHIISFDFSHESILNKFITSCIIDSSFQRLESIVLYEISTFKLLVFLFHLKFLPRLFSLSICLFECYDNLGDIYGILFRFPVLKYLKFEVSENEDVTMKIPIASEEQYSSIEYLAIHFCCTLNELAELISYTPRLSHLSCPKLFGSEANIKFEVLTKLTTLVYLNVTISQLKFDEFEGFLLNLCSQLKFLSISIKCQDQNYLDGDRWEGLISDKMPFLTEFIFCYYDSIQDHFAVFSYHSLINGFTSPFWIQRKWILRIIPAGDQIFYEIRLYRDDFPIHGADLDLTNPFLSTAQHLFLYKIRSLAEIIEITRLDVDCEETAPDLLIKILNSLPNLDSLTISGLPSYDEIYEMIDDENQINKFLKNNKITKFTLRNITDIDEISLIIHYFPRLQYFALQSMKNFNLQSIVQRTLLMIKKNKIFHPTELCIFDTTAEHDVVDKLKQMIDSERLLKDYQIHRRLNRFYFQWK